MVRSRSAIAWRRPTSRRTARRRPCAIGGTAEPARPPRPRRVAGGGSRSWKRGAPRRSRPQANRHEAHPPAPRGADRRRGLRRKARSLALVRLARDLARTDQTWLSPKARAPLRYSRTAQQFRPRTRSQRHRRRATWRRPRPRAGGPSTVRLPRASCPRCPIRRGARRDLRRTRRRPPRWREEQRYVPSELTGPT